MSILFINNFPINFLLKSPIFDFTLGALFSYHNERWTWAYWRRTQTQPNQSCNLFTQVSNNHGWKNVQYETKTVYNVRAKTIWYYLAKLQHQQARSYSFSGSHYCTDLLYILRWYIMILLGLIKVALRGEILRRRRYSTLENPTETNQLNSDQSKYPTKEFLCI